MSAPPLEGIITYGEAQMLCHRFAKNLLLGVILFECKWVFGIWPFAADGFFNFGKIHSHGLSPFLIDSSWFSLLAFPELPDCTSQPMVHANDTTLLAVAGLCTVVRNILKV